MVRLKLGWGWLPSPKAAVYRRSVWRPHRSGASQNIQSSAVWLSKAPLPPPSHTHLRKWLHVRALTPSVGISQMGRGGGGGGGEEGRAGRSRWREMEEFCLVSLGLMLSCPPPVVSSSSARLSNLGTLSTSSASASRLLQSSVPDPLTVGLKLMVTSFSKMSI